MKKLEIHSASGLAMHSAAMGDYSLPVARFEKNAINYLAGKIPASIFIEICDLALDAAGKDIHYISLVHKYRYTAHMAADYLQ